ncbi:MAG: amidohydrolase family protein [Sphingomonas sp.]|uniref:amidohydrolase family protein n=1 Tax=Sphingomonas sp. TaxID=28214 RepID=UPI003F7DB133
MIRALLATLVLVALPGMAAAQTIAIVHARAMPVASAPIDDATIVLDGSRIRSVVAHGPVPAGARVIDAAGRVVTPGLIGAATQLGLVEVLGARDTDDQAVASGPLGPAFDVQYAINANSALLPVARADGVTRAMTYPGGAATTPFSGMGAVIRLVPDGDVLETPRAAMFAAIGNTTQAKAGGSRAAQWVLLRNALDEARRFATAPRSAGPRDQLLDRPDIEALGAVIAGRMPLAIQADRESDIRQAIRLAADQKVRVVILGGAEAWRAADALAAAGIPVILDPEADLPQTFDALGARLDNAALLAKAGVTIAFSVSGNGIYLSYDAGIDMREGAGIAVANGLPYADGLKAMTAGPARIWGLANAGTLAPGADADVVIWDGDPLEPASAPVAVFVKGVQASLSTRQTALRDRYAPARANDPMPAAYR